MASPPVPDDRLAAPGVCDGHDRRAGLLQVRGDRVGRVVGGEDRDPRPGEDAVVAQIGRRGRGQHDARAVVTGEHDRALDGAGREDDPPGADVPQPALDGRGGGALGDDDVAVVVDAERRRPGHDADLRERRERLGVLDHGSLVDEQHAVAVARRRQRPPPGPPARRRRRGRRNG